MSCICESTWKALCALKDAITSPCSSRGDDEPLTQSNNNSNVSIDSNLVLDDRVIEVDLGLTNAGFDNDSFTTKALENSPGAGAWRTSVLRFHDPVTDEPHADSGHWTNQSVFTDVDLGDGGAVDEVDAASNQENKRTDSNNTARESGYGRSLDDSTNSSTSQEPSVSVTYNPRPNPGVSTVSPSTDDPKVRFTNYQEQPNYNSIPKTV